MKKVITAFGIGILGAVLISFTGSHKCEPNNNDATMAYFSGSDSPFIEGWNLELLAENLEVEDIVYIEEENFQLGFDTTVYLPLGFNAYEGMELELADIEYIEDEDEVLLNFDTKDYLPADFTTSSR